MIQNRNTPPTLNYRVAFEGEYTIRKYSRGGVLLQEIGPFSNLITDIGLDSLYGGPGYVQAFVGTGSSTPSTLDTQLNNYLAKSNWVGDIPGVSWNGSAARGGAPDYWVQGVGTFPFGQGVAAGNISEVAVGWFDSAAGTDAQKHRCFSRALILDGDGDPTTITVLSDEFLEVIYALKMYPYMGADSVQTISINGSDYTFTTRALNVGAVTMNGPTYNGTSGFGSLIVSAVRGSSAIAHAELAAVTATGMSDATSIGVATAGARDAYIPGSYSVKRAQSFALANGNHAYGISGFTAENAASSSKALAKIQYQTSVRPPIMKTSSDVLSFKVGFSWGRRA